MRNKLRVMPGFRHSQGKDVDGRDKPGHDVEAHCLSFVMPAHSRPCLSIVMPGFMPGTLFTTCKIKDVDDPDKPGHDKKI